MQPCSPILSRCRCTRSCIIRRAREARRWYTAAARWGCLRLPSCARCIRDVRVLAVARFRHQAELARKFGAETVLQHKPARAVIEGVAHALGVELREPWYGLPMLNGGVDIVYDTVTAPATLEVGVRVARARGRIVALGVEVPKAFEWTPLYHKELSLVGLERLRHRDVRGPPPARDRVVFRAAAHAAHRRHADHHAPLPAQGLPEGLSRLSRSGRERRRQGAIRFLRGELIQNLNARRAEA